jgi:hypothetical protein
VLSAAKLPVQDTELKQRKTMAAQNQELHSHLKGKGDVQTLTMLLVQQLNPWALAFKAKQVSNLLAKLHRL